MIRNIEKIAKRHVRANFSCRESIKVVRSLYGQFGVEMFKHIVRLEREKIKSLTLVAI
jgi:hypothetical protein